jgi:hypothetical protein
VSEAFSGFPAARLIKGGSCFLKSYRLETTIAVVSGGQYEHPAGHPQGDPQLPMPSASMIAIVLRGHSVASQRRVHLLTCRNLKLDLLDDTLSHAHRGSLINAAFVVTHLPFAKQHDQRATTAISLEFRPPLVRLIRRGQPLFRKGSRPFDALSNGWSR